MSWIVGKGSRIFFYAVFYIFLHTFLNGPIIKKTRSLASKEENASLRCGKAAVLKRFLSDRALECRIRIQRRQRFKEL